MSIAIDDQGLGNQRGFREGDCVEFNNGMKVSSQECPRVVGFKKGEPFARAIVSVNKTTIDIDVRFLLKKRDKCC